MKKNTKKIFMMLATVTILLASSCAQNSKPAEPVRQALSKTELDAKLKPFFEKMDSVPQDSNGTEVIKQMAIEFIEANPNDAGVYVIKSVLAYTMPAEEIIAFIDGNEYFKADSTIINERQLWDKQVETAEGKMFTDFEAEYDGKVVKLSDYVGKGKYVLVDFWASWCGPCRAEIPNLLSVYEKYKGDNFEVLGVATWDAPEDTKTAIEQLGITYPQIMNAQKAGSDAYGINGIPQIILFGPDGTILKRNLRGAAIEDAVQEALK